MIFMTAPFVSEVSAFHLWIFSKSGSVSICFLTTETLGSQRNTEIIPV